MYRELDPLVKEREHPEPIYSKWWFQTWFLMLFTYVATTAVSFLLGAECNMNQFVGFLSLMSIVGLTKMAFDKRPKKQ